jgi:predicted lysophospholipase L1 biosynthesis ABC-type transport system permease subunit
VSQGPEQSAGASPAGGRRARLLSIVKIAVFDVGGPLVLYSLLRAHGFSAVAALILSGIFPAIGVAISIIQNRRLDVIGVLVLGGILVGTVIGLISHSARLLLIEGSVPTGLFGLVCLGSLWARRPLMYVFALEFTGPDTAKGREFESLWQYREFRHTFRVITAVWGAGYLVEAAVRVLIVEHTSTGTALASSKVTPFIFAGVLAAWTALYGSRQRRKGERLAAAMEAASRAESASGGTAPSEAARATPDT